MKNVVSGLIAQASQLLSKVSPFAKAVVPSAAGLVGALVNMAIAGSFNLHSIESLGLGVVTSIVTYLVPNRAKPAPAPAPKAKGK